MKFNVADYHDSLGSQLFGSNIKYIEKVKSTNDEIWNLKIDENGLVVIADKQINGRGRRGNFWFTKDYKSLSFSLGITNRNVNLLPQKIAISIAESIRKQAQVEATIKWPNDILIDDKKVAGVLIEKKNQVINIGIGINVNIQYDDFPIDIRNDMTSLYEQNKKYFSREKLLSMIMKMINYNFDLDGDSIISKWNNMCAHNNSNIEFHDDNKIIKGMFIGINQSGYALIKVNDKINYYAAGIIKL